MPKFALLWLAIILVFPLAGCQTKVALEFTSTPTETPIPTATSTATSTVTPSATATAIPTDTPSPTVTKTRAPTRTPVPDCNVDVLMKQLKLGIAYDEFTLLYRTEQKITTLIIWFVDPEVDPQATGDEIEVNARLAMRHAATISQQIDAADVCVGILFDKINPVVVDSSYNGWFSGQIAPSLLPDVLPTDEQGLDAICDQFDYETSGYLRILDTIQMRAAPAGSCTWKEANEAIHNHFDPERQNVGFYLVVDETGVNFFGQWDQSNDMGLDPKMMTFVALLNVTMELECLSPQPNQLFITIVDPQGNVTDEQVIPWP